MNDKVDRREFVLGYDHESIANDRIADIAEGGRIVKLQLHVPVPLREFLRLFQVEGVFLIGIRHVGFKEYLRQGKIQRRTLELLTAQLRDHQRHLIFPEQLLCGVSVFRVKFSDYLSAVFGDMVSL